MVDINSFETKLREIKYHREIAGCCPVVKFRFGINRSFYATGCSHPINNINKFIEECNGYCVYCKKPLFSQVLEDTVM